MQKHAQLGIQLSKCRSYHSLKCNPHNQPYSNPFER